MNTRSTTAYTRQGVLPKYAIVAFREPLTCAIYDIEKLDKPRKKVSGATIKVEVNDGLRKGTIVSTAEKFDTLVPKLKEFNIRSFFGLRKQKGVPRAIVVKKRVISEFQITSPQKRSKIDTKIQKTVPAFLASDGKTMPVPTDISPTPPHSDPNLINEQSSPKISSSYDIIKSEGSFSSDETDILNQQFFASPSSSENSSVESGQNVCALDLLYLREPPRDANGQAELSALEHTTPTVYPEIPRLPSPILPLPSHLRNSPKPSKYSACSNSDKYVPSSCKTGLSHSSTPKESSVRSMPILVPSATRLKTSSVVSSSTKLDKCSTVVSASFKRTKFPNADSTPSTSIKPSTIVLASTESVKSSSFMPQSSRSGIPQTIISTVKPSKVVKPSTIPPTPIKPSIAVPEPSKVVKSFAELPLTHIKGRPTDLPTHPKQTTASAVLPLFSKPTNVLNIIPPATVALHKTVSQESYKQAKSSSGSVVEPSAPKPIFSDSSKQASHPPQPKNEYRHTMRYSPCSGADSRYLSNTTSHPPQPMGAYRHTMRYSPCSGADSRYSPNIDSYYRPMSRYSPYQDTYLQNPRYSPYSDSYSRTPRMELFPRLFPQQTPEYHPPMANYRPIDLSNSIPPFPESPAWASSFEEFVPQLPLPPFRGAQTLPRFPVTSTESSCSMATERHSQNETQERLLVTDPRFMKLKVVNILGQKIDIEIIKKRIKELPKEDVKEDESLPYIISEKILTDSLVESDQLPERFAVKLLDRIFTLEELEGRNVYGTHHVTKGALNRRKMAAIDEAVKSIFPGTYHIWRICVNSINSHIRYVLQKIPQLYRVEQEHSSGS